MSDKLKVYFLDVGQGDASLLRFPGGKTLLVDGGGGNKGSDFDVGKRIVAPALWRMGVHRIDWMLLTHPHHDHYKGLGYMAESFKPALIWTNGRDSLDDERDDWEEFKGSIDVAGVPMAVVGDGIVEKVGDAVLRIFKPCKSQECDLNESSLVTDIRYGETRILIMGDLLGEGEREFIAMDDGRRANILKIAHHGADDATADELLDLLDPEFSVISVGADNKYGVPHEETLMRLERHGARVFRTDYGGMISAVSDGKEVVIETLAGVLP